MSSKGVTDMQREKMREEAKKERAQKAKAANILVRNEHKIRDFGFVSRKVAPDADDPFSHSLKNGLIDYHEILGTKDHQFLGIDNNVPGTPEFDIVSCEDAFKKHPFKQTNTNKQNQTRLNGYKINHESISTSSKTQHSQELYTTSGSVSKKTNELNKSETQQKPKPKTLSMPSSRKTTPTTTDKTPRAHPSKIESILKEMTDTTPPLTDIQTPVKTQDTRFPFPHLPPAKDHTAVAAVQGKPSSQIKTEETLKNDLITTSDDETEDEGPHGEKLQNIPNTGAGNLSASSSSSEESSSDSSESDSSDSENETRHTGVVGKKAMKKPIMSKHSTSNAAGPIFPTSMPSCQKSVRGKVMKEEMCEKQVSPLNSFSAEKEKKTQRELSPANGPFEVNSKRANPIHNGMNDNLDVDAPSVFSGDYFDPSHLDPFFDELGPLFDNTHPNDITSNNESLDSIPMMDLEQMPSAFETNLNSNNVNYSNETSNLIEMVGNNSINNGKEETILYNGDYDSNKIHALTKENFHGHNNDINTAMCSKEHFNHMTVDVNAITQSPSISFMMDDIHSQKVAQKGSTSLDKHQDKLRRKDFSNALDNLKKPIPTQLQTRITPSKKDYENDWFKKILSPGKKHYDLPYVNPEKLKFVGAKEPRHTTPLKLAKAGPLKIQIPLGKIGRYQSKSEAPDRKVSMKGSKHIDKTAHQSGKTIRNDSNDSVKKVRRKYDSKTPKAEKPQRQQSGGKDMETIKSLMAELSSKGTSDDDEIIDVVTTSPLKKTRKPELTVSGKAIRSCPVSNAKIDLNSQLSPDLSSKNQSKSKTNTKNNMNHVKIRKRTRSNDTFEDKGRMECKEDTETIPPCRTSSKHMKSDPDQDDNSILDMDLDDDSSEAVNAFNGLVNDASRIPLPEEKLFVKIPLWRLQRLPGSRTSSGNIEEHKQEEIMEQVAIRTENGPEEPVWKPPPKIKIPRITKCAPSNITAMKQVENCCNAQQDCTEQGTSNASNHKSAKEKKLKRIPEGRGVKRRDRERAPKYNNQNPNVCGMCGTLQKDSGRDPIRLGAYKTSYSEYFSMGKRNKHIADCHDPSDRGPKYIDAVLKFIQYLVGLEITGKTTTKRGAEEYMCLTSQCIDLVGHVVSQYGKKENNNISKFDDRFLFLCLRLQSVLYFKLFGIKKDSTSRCSKLLSEYFKIRPSPQRVSMKGSTGTPSPMSPSSSHNGSVASFGSAKSSASSGSFDKLSSGNMVSIPVETFERMQQYTTYTRFWLHGQRLWDEAEALAHKCQEFIKVVSHQVGALTHESSMLHLVDYVSAGLEIIKEDQS